MSITTVIKPGIRKEKCINKEHPIFVPQPHQQKVADYFLTSPHRGLLLYHLLGSGKTCTSILVADEMLRQNKVKHVFVLTPGSLRTNWIYEYCNKCGDITTLKKNFTFITYNYNIFESIKAVDFNDSLVIIDEAHNLINGAKNLSKNPYSLYIQVLNSNARVLVLTATVIFNNTFEWCLLGNLLKDNTFPNIIQTGELDTAYFEFKKDEIMSPENMSGIISYFAGNMGEFPEVIYNPPIKVLMSPIQDAEYNAIAEKESEFRRRGPPKRDLLRTDPTKYKENLIRWILCKKYILSRSITNIYYPPEKYKENVNKEEEKDIENQLIEYINSKKEEDGEKDFTNIYDNASIDENGKIKFGNKKKDRLIKNGGWMDRSILDNKNLLTYSPKFVALITNILKNYNSKHVIFSFYIENGGIRFIHTILKMCGIKSAIYSGDVSSEKRQQILNRFNRENNMHGEKVKVLLLTEAGGEGITLLEVGHVHILESNTVANKVKQVIGRSVRYRSHARLPKEERVVNIWKYHAYSRGEYLCRSRERNNAPDDSLIRKIDLPASSYCEEIFNILNKDPSFKITPKFKNFILNDFELPYHPPLENFKDYYNYFIKDGGYDEDFNYIRYIEYIKDDIEDTVFEAPYGILSTDKYLEDMNIDKYGEFEDFYKVLIDNSIEINNLV